MDTVWMLFAAEFLVNGDGQSGNCVKFTSSAVLLGRPDELRLQEIPSKFHPGMTYDAQKTFLS
jgi:hypothetical protein